MKYFLTLFVILLCSFAVYPQEVFKGTIIDNSNYPVPYAKVCKLHSSICTYTDEEGQFTLSVKAKDSIQVDCIGYSTSTFLISSTSQTFRVNEKSLELEDVTIKNKTEEEVKKEEGFAVDIIELKEYENTKADINSVLEESSGVVIRQSGGLGSDYNFSLNGLSGKQVKFFIDGIPLDNYGSSFTPNNFPVNLIKNVEVYKGAVPIRLGADALGGAINLVTDDVVKNYLNATYSVGSFNTHRIGLTGQYTHKDYFVRAMGFFNYSDNNYVMDDIAVTDDLGNFNDTVSVRRFHDQYQSTLINLNAGVISKNWVDRFTVGYSFNSNKNNVQHFLSVFTPFGQMKRLNELHSVNVRYEKSNFILPELSVDVFSTASIQTTTLVDTSSKAYDWFGDYVIKEALDLGETNDPKSVFEFKDKILISRVNLNYDLNPTQKLEFNYTQNHLQRQGQDSLAVEYVSFSDPHSLSKHIAGVSHNLKYAKNKGNSTVFLKGYLVNYKLITSDFSGERTQVDKTNKSIGYGVAQSFKLNDNWLAKFSYERSYRIPDAYEIFGDGFTLLSNTELEAETSNNFNLGLIFNKEIKHFKIHIQENLFLRRANNFITIESVGAFSRFFNKNKVNIWGSETELKISFKENYNFSTNITYQSIRDDEGYRLANIPYLFGHTSLGYRKPDFIKKENTLHAFLSYNLRQEFYLLSPALGSKEFKNIIPSQSNLDFTLAHSFLKNKYQVSATVANIFNQKLYDNFRLQKPGRNFRLMFKYFLK